MTEFLFTLIKNNYRIISYERGELMEKRYYELYTEYGTLYYYAVKEDNKLVSDVYEFFTKEKGKYNYESILFYDGRCEFPICHRDLNGEIRGRYIKELDAFDFLLKVAPYLKNNEIRENKVETVREIFRKKEHNIPNNEPVLPDLEITKEQKNGLAAKILTLYTK
jgi:hypothetical protein